MDTSNPAAFVNAELLRLYVGRKVRTVIKVLGTEAGKTIGQSTDDKQLTILGLPPLPTAYVEVIGIVQSNLSIQPETWSNFGETFDMANYNQLCVLANGDYKHLFI